MPAQSPSKTPEPTERDAAAAERRRRFQRRRATALAGLAVLVLVVSLLVDGGSGGGRSRVNTRAASPVRAPDLGEAARRRAAAENRAIDRVLAYSQFVTSGGGRKREVALTFDDGPGPYTQKVLGVLRKFNVQATFFEVGFMERWFHSGTTQALREGHTIGDHTESHPKLALLKRPAQRKQIMSQADWLSKLGVPRPRLFRPPFGSFDARTFTVLRNNRLLMVLWSVDTHDYNQPGVKRIVRRAVQGAKPGAIILMHDAGGPRSQTIAALPEIIRKLRKRRFKLVTVPQLLVDDPPPHGQRLPHYLTGG